jgi:hypothetical protein
MFRDQTAETVRKAHGEQASRSLESSSGEYTHEEATSTGSRMMRLSDMQAHIGNQTSLQWEFSSGASGDAQAWSGRAQAF